MCYTEFLVRPGSYGEPAAVGTVCSGPEIILTFASLMAGGFKVNKTLLSFDPTEFMV